MKAKGTRMRARIFADENKKWWTLAAVSFGLFMIMLDNTVVNVALPSIQRSLAPQGFRARVGRRRLRADLRRVHAHRRQARRPASAGADLRRRPRRSSPPSSLACGLAGQRDDPDRRARRPGPRRGDDEPGDALDHHRHLPAAAARDGDRHLGRRLGARARDRPARRRPDHRSTSTGTGSSSSTSRSA